MYKIQIIKSADKQLKSLEAEERNKISEVIQQLSYKPRPEGCKKLKDTNLYRIRIGNFRVIYEIEDKILLILIIRVGHRKDIYR